VTVDELLLSLPPHAAKIEAARTVREALKAVFCWMGMSDSEDGLTEAVAGIDPDRDTIDVCQEDRS
jgi:hypothetical protein